MELDPDDPELLVMEFEDGILVLEERSKMSILKRLFYLSLGGTIGVLAMCFLLIGKEDEYGSYDE